MSKLKLAFISLGFATLLIVIVAPPSNVLKVPERVNVGAVLITTGKDTLNLEIEVAAPDPIPAPIVPSPAYCW
jgi:hypothetical protein